MENRMSVPSLCGRTEAVMSVEAKPRKRRHDVQSTAFFANVLDQGSLKKLEIFICSDRKTMFARVAEVMVGVSCGGNVIIH